MPFEYGRCCIVFLRINDEQREIPALYFTLLSDGISTTRAVGGDARDMRPQICHLPCEAAHVYDAPFLFVKFAELEEYTRTSHQIAGWHTSSCRFEAPINTCI